MILQKFRFGVQKLSLVFKHYLLMSEDGERIVIIAILRSLWEQSPPKNFGDLMIPSPLVAFLLTRS